MSRFRDLILGKASPSPEPVVETAPEPVVEEKSTKLSGFLSDRLKRNKKSIKTDK